jgi:Autotransporter beta-domain
MTRRLLAAAASLAPLILAAGAAHAQVEITSGVTTPLVTATSATGLPSTADISSSGSVGLTTPGVAVTVNSSTTVTNEGEIGATDVNGATGVQLVGGNTGSFTSTGTILITESYTAATDNNNGLLTGVYAEGTDRIGIQVVGPGSFNGGITTTGAVTVHGNDSYGVDFEAPITGSFLMQTVSPTTFTSSTTVTVTNGSINVLGNGSIGLYMAPTGGVGGNMQIGTITANGGQDANGVGTQGAVINGTVGGVINVSGTVSATGYRTTARSTDSTIEATYTAQELQQSGSAMTIGGTVNGGVIISTPPLILSTTNPDLDGNGVPDAQQPPGEIVVYGQAPALVIGVGTQNAYLGVVGAGNGITVPGSGGTMIIGGANTYGLVIQGSVIGEGVFDPITTPGIIGTVPGNVISGTAMQIGTGNGSYTATIAGGILNTGLIEGEAYQANATAIHFIAGGVTPQIVNDGSIFATSLQVTTTAGTSGYSPVNVYGILMDAGANVTSIVNNSTIEANITGTGGAGATEVGAIIDRSGNLSNITNTGTILAQADQTELGQQMPVGQVVAIDMSRGTGPQTLNQSTNPNLPPSAAYVQTTTYTVGQYVNYQNQVYEALTTVSTAQDPVDYPTLWRPVGALTPSIIGNIYFGSGGTTMTINSGTVTSSIINLGAGANTLTIAGGTPVPGGSASCTGVTCAEVYGAIEVAPYNAASAAVGFTDSASLTAMGSGQLTININNGTLTDLNPNKINATSLNIGANGMLIVSADPVNHTNTEFFTSGASSFAQGAQIGINLLSLPSSFQQVYTILQTTGSGTLTAGTFAANAVGNAPFLFYANAAYVPASGGAPAAIDLTVTRKTAAELGFNTAEGNALDAVLAAAPQNAAIQSALLAQTTQSGLKAVYDQLLPNQGQGLFDALNSAAESVSSMISTPPDNGQRVGGSSLWLQEVNEQVNRTGIDSPGSYTKLVGIVGGWEHMGVAGGALGMTLAYYNDSEIPTASQGGSGVVGNLVEASLYYRRSMGNFTFAARGGIGGAFFDSDREFLAPGTTLNAAAHYSALFYDGHVGVSYKQSIIGRFYIRPELSADYLGMDFGAYTETGGGPGFDLAVASQNDSQLTGAADLAIGRSWGQEAWLQSEVRLGVREVLVDSLGDTVATFSGGSPFYVTPDNEAGGWATIGFSLRAGSPSSYFALEGEGDFRNGEQIYDVRIAGRTMF